MRHEHYDKFLLAAGTLICAVLTVVIGTFETTKPSAANPVPQSQARVEQLPPVRVVGTPFVLNTNPSARLPNN